MKLILPLLLILVSCQDHNSSSSDRTLYGPVDLDQSDTNFIAAQKIISDKCISCHSGYHSSWSAMTSTSDWLAQNQPAVLIQKGDPEGSYLLETIRTGYMPQSPAPDVTDEELAVLEKWVEEIQ